MWQTSFEELMKKHVVDGLGGEFIHYGTSDDHNATEFAYREVFNDLCYAKLFVPVHGAKVELTTCPANLLLGIDDWYVCKLGASPRAVYVAYDRRADAVNTFWERAAKRAKATTACVFRGDLVFFKWRSSVDLPPDKLFDELVSYMKARYNKHATYYFSVWR